MIPQLQDIKQDFTFAQLPTNTLKMDNDTRLIAGYVDGLEAMEQAIRIIRSTERYKYVIHSWNFGVELLDLFGQPIPYVLPEIKRRIREALLQDDRILSVDNFTFQTEKNKVFTAFTVTTIFGAVEIEKVVDV